MCVRNHCSCKHICQKIAFQTSTGHPQMFVFVYIGLTFSLYRSKNLLCGAYIFISKMTYYMSSGTLNPTHSLVVRIACTLKYLSGWLWIRLEPRLILIYRLTNDDHTERRSVTKTDVFTGICFFVGLDVNTITSEWVNIGWWNSGVGALHKKLGRIRSRGS